MAASPVSHEWKSAKNQLRELAPRSKPKRSRQHLLRFALCLLPHFLHCSAHALANAGGKCGVSASASAIPSIRADAKRERCSELLGMTFVTASKGLPVISPFAVVGPHGCGVPPVATAIDCDCELCRLRVLGCPDLPASRFPGYFLSVTAHREQKVQPAFCSWIRKESYTTPCIISYNLRMCTEWPPFAIYLGVAEIFS